MNLLVVFLRLAGRSNGSCSLMPAMSLAGMHLNAAMHASEASGAVTVTITTLFMHTWVQALVYHFRFLKMKAHS